LLSSLDAVENAAIRIATGAYRSSPVLSMYAESGLKPPACYREIKLLNFYCRIIANPTHPMHEFVVEDEEDDYESENEERLYLINKGFLNRIKCIKQRYNLNFTNILPETFPPSPPWRLPNVNVCNDLCGVKKSTVSTQEMKMIFIQHRNEHGGYYPIYTDGSKSDAGVGYAFISDDSEHMPDASSQRRVYSLQNC
jgi:hypothetical protein